MGAPMGGPMGAPMGGAPPHAGMNMQPGAPMGGAPMGGAPFGQNPNASTLSTAMNSSTMSTTAPPGQTTMMVSHTSMASTGQVVPHEPPSPSKSHKHHDAPFGSAEIRDEIKGWAVTGSQIGKHALEKLENVERRVRIIEKGVER